MGKCRLLGRSTGYGGSCGNASVMRAWPSTRRMRCARSVLAARRWWPGPGPSGGSVWVNAPRRRETGCRSEGGVLPSSGRMAAADGEQTTGKRESLAEG